MPVSFGGEQYALSVARDITERRERERELKRSEARLRATVEAAFDCVIGMDGEGRIVEFNAAAERVFGHARADVLGRLVADVILPERRREAHNQWLRQYDATGHGTDGGPAGGDHGDPRRRHRISHRDRRERGGRARRKHLRRAPARHQRAARRRTGTPRTGRAAAPGAEDGGHRPAHRRPGARLQQHPHQRDRLPRHGAGAAAAQADPVLARQLGQARLAADRARDHVAQLLAFSRPQRGERRAARGGLGGSPGAATAASDATHLHRGRTQRAPDGRPAAGLADPVQLEQVLFNLCINARDAIRRPGHDQRGIGYSQRIGQRCASCGARLDSGRWVWVEVEDDGCGMPPDVLERMFEPFFTTKEVGRGTGMGLAMVHGIVHDHGGHIRSRIGARPGIGVPGAVAGRRRGAAKPGPPKRSGLPRRPAGAVARPGAVGRGRGHGGRLHAGPAVRLGAGGGAGARPARAAGGWPRPTNPFDLLLTDQTMPGMTGLALARQARGHRPGLPVLLYTGNAMASTRRNSRAAACATCCASPSPPSACVKRSRNCCRPGEWPRQPECATRKRPSGWRQPPAWDGFTAGIPGRDPASRAGGCARPAPRLRPSTSRTRCG